MPSTLTGLPTKALVAPGQCQFNEEFQTVALIKSWKISDTTFVLRFSLPDKSKPLNLSTCACILAKADLPNRNNDNKLEAVIRPYTPISTNEQIGSFDLMIKNYGDNGRMSTHLCQMKEGQTLEFKHIPFNVKIQAPFDYDTITMLVGGTGITPMIQAMHAILGDPTSTTKVIVVYGSRVSNDILGQELLESWLEKNSDRLSVHHILSHEPKDGTSTWKGARGFINQDFLMNECKVPPPSDPKHMIFVCGPPPMYNALCGPREEPKELKGLLHNMGYQPEQVFKF